MAPSLSDEMNYFAIMGLTPSASEADIRKAHKKMSLALHPDKNRDVDPVVAAARFSEMQLAYEVLMDPNARLAAAERMKADTVRKERRDAYEGKRKAMAEELERREEEDRQKRFKGVHDERKRAETVERLREEGRRLCEERDRRARAANGERGGDREESIPLRTGTAVHTVDKDSTNSTSPEPELGPLDLTVKVRFPVTLFDAMTASDNNALTPTANQHASSALARGLSSRFGQVDSVVFRKPKTGKREATAHATFMTLEAAQSAVELGGKLQAGGFGEARILDDVWIGWANGEPERSKWRRKHQQERRTNDQWTKTASEADILRRLRESAQERKASQTPTPGSSSPFPSFSFSSASPKEA